MRIDNGASALPTTIASVENHGAQAPVEAPEAVPGAADLFQAASAQRSVLEAKSGTGGGPVFTGFDAAKLAAPLKLGGDGRPKSAKYTFAKLAQESGQMPQSKAEAEAWFNKFIKPGMEAAGFGVDWVKGDKALIRTRENPQGEVVDFVRGAGSNDPSYIALAWQPEDAGGGGGGGGGSFFAPSTSSALNPFASNMLELSAEERALIEALRRAQQRKPA